MVAELVGAEVEWRVAFGLCCLMDALSLAACALLCWRIGRLPAPRRARLFPQQATVLALSDAFLAVAGVIYGLHGYGTCGPAPFPLLALLFWTYDATLLAELQIVLGFACQMFGLAKANRCLISFVWLPWVLAALSAASQMAFSAIHGFQWIGAEMFAACVCFPISMLTFAAILWRANTCGDAVSRRCWRRASAYVTNFLITFAPCIAWTFLQGDTHRMTLPRLLAAMGLHSNGLVNALTYFAQSRYGRGELQAELPDVAGSKPSFAVRFEGVCRSDLHDDAEDY